MCRRMIVTVLLALIAGNGTSQVMLLSNGGCSVGPSGVMGCSWMSPLPHRDHGIRVNQYALAPQAPLVVEPSEDVIIVAADEGQLDEETNAPNGHMHIFKGAALLVPKGKRTVLRNTGDKGLILVEIVIGKSS